MKHKIYNYYHKELTRIQYEQAAGSHLKIVSNNLSDLYESKELEKKIHDKIMTLPPQCRKVFLMSREEQMPYKEIAKQLNISVNTVDQHIQKALRLLRGSVGGMAYLFKWASISLLALQFASCAN